MSVHGTRIFEEIKKEESHSTEEVLFYPVGFFVCTSKRDIFENRELQINKNMFFSSVRFHIPVQRRFLGKGSHIFNRNMASLL